jgi:predicted metalloprotease
MSRKTVRLARMGAVFALLLSLVLGVVGRPAAVGAQTSSTSDSGVSGSTYTSPSFGYSLEWDRSWDVSDEKVEDDYNMLRLDDAASIMYIEGYAPALAADECLAQYGTDYIENSDGVSDFAAEKPQESADGALSVEVSFVLTFTDDKTGKESSSDFNGFVSCQEINDGDANLVITHLALADSWDDESAAREDVLSTLTFEGETPDTGTPTEEETPDTGTTEPNNNDGTGQMTDIQGDGELPDNADELLSLFQTSVSDINDYWAREYPLISGGQTYAPPKAFVPWTGNIDTACGTADSFNPNTGTGMGPFYCPPDQTIYLDMDFANFQFDSVGEVPFLIPVVLAHEVGHHVQDELGMQVCYQTPCLDPNVLTSQEIEYMADCYAGSWSRDAELRGRLGSSDIDANIVQYAVLLGGGKEGADPGGHGEGPKRVWWFLNGYVEGAAKCFETSKVTAGWAQSGPPNANSNASADETPTPEDEPTTEPDNGNSSSATSQMGDELDTSEGTITVKETQVQNKIERRTADGTYLIVFMDVIRPEGGDPAPFNYDAWTATDSDGNVYELDGRATDVLLSTAYDNGSDEELDPGTGYTIAVVFDVPEDASGFTLVNEDEGVSVELDK